MCALLVHIEVGDESNSLAARHALVETVQEQQKTILRQQQELLERERELSMLEPCKKIGSLCAAAAWWSAQVISDK